MIKAVLLAPIQNSLYARLVAFQLAQEKDIKISAIIVRSPWNLRRFRSEFTRDGFRLIKKIHQKLLKGDRRFSDVGSKNLAALAVESGLPYRSLKQIARELKIPYRSVANHNHPRSLDLIEKASPDVILFTGGGLLRAPILEIPRLGVLNCHTGILPQYRGMDVVEWTVLEDKADTIGLGVSLHFMDRGVDTGPILLKEKLVPEPQTSFQSIRAQLEVMMVRLMIDGVRGLASGKLFPQTQDPLVGKQYYVMHPRIRHAAEQKLALSKQ